MAIVSAVPALIDKLRGTRLYLYGMVALFTGIRLGEIPASRWGCVDLDKRPVINVREAVE